MSRDDGHFWTYRRDEWRVGARWWWRWIPFHGSDEFCRHTIVLPIPFGGYLVTALWVDRKCRSEHP